MIFLPIGVTLRFFPGEVQTPSLLILRRSQHYQHASSLLFWNILDFSRRSVPVSRSPSKDAICFALASLMLVESAVDISRVVIVKVHCVAGLLGKCQVVWPLLVDGIADVWKRVIGCFVRWRAHNLLCSLSDFLLASLMDLTRMMLFACTTGPSSVAKNLLLAAVPLARDTVCWALHILLLLLITTMIVEG